MRSPHHISPQISMPPAKSTQGATTNTRARHWMM
nr:MAG TPA: hypothetical protein [Caudoviricetes sp.]